ncbi:dihydroxyacetone kinase phosphoryl donor subunit DhaM [Mycoplasmopsis anatis]|uniref:dihydroxyacetone kinase phosphoryl donor subunit DhaM n=1 Tax=Mycoplasmopsis anatis TaxID=171279 RepID=UPI001301169D|nr:dihydroxyacetone kinase phosphoryl donor subunit DhaM [Mycoplasmopsis anatis]
MVSHSKKLAQAAIELASIMKNSDFKIVNAAGLIDGEGFGTDVQKIIDSINSVNDGDGVLVFCEIGSSLMSSQMAVEMINDKKVILVDAPFVESLMVATATNNENTALSDLLKETLLTKTFSKQ